MTTNEMSLQQRVSALEARWSSIQDDLMLRDVLDGVQAVQTALSTLPVTLQQARTRGYMYRAFLERKIQVLTDQWAPTSAQVAQQVQSAASTLRMDSIQVNSLLSQMRVAAATNSASGAGLAGQADSALAALESKASATRSTLNGMYSDLKTNVDQTKAQIDEINLTLDRRDQACFRLLAGEDIVLAVEAQWDKDGKDDPKGILYLTDGRVLFEQKEQVAKKKVLFIATEKELVQQLVLEAAVADVESLKAVSKGMFGKDDFLEFTFRGKAPVRAASIHIWYEGQDWQTLFGRVQSGEIARERTKPKDQAVLEAVKAAPTRCPTCGASMNVTVTVGMTQITCDYCGSAIRL